jgi:DNA-binding transcriptional MerR regulator
MAEATWRIDELARRAGLTVDTIRYYAREGLLRPPARNGRNRLYGPDHLGRLARIRELQQRRFSLAAIRAIVEVDRPGLEGLFAAEGREYTLAELADEAGLDAAFVAEIRRIGLLPDPAEFGGESYRDTDLGVLRAVSELRSIGMPPEVVLSLGRLYVDHFNELQRDVLDMLSGRLDPEWDADELASMQAQLTSNAQRLLPAVNELLTYVHQRTLQRLTLEAARAADATAATGSSAAGDDASHDG